MSAVSGNQRGSLSKGLRILAAFDERSSALTIADISKRTEISRTSVYRLAAILEELGYLQKEERLYCPSKKVLRLGVAAVESRELVDHIRPYLDQISSMLPQATAINYGVLEATDIVYLARRHLDDIITINLRVGSRLPAYLSSMGKAILSAMPPQKAQEVVAEMTFQPRTAHTITSADACLQQIRAARRKGIALNNQELTVGLRSVAAPVLCRSDVIGAVGVATLATRADLDTLEHDYGPILRSVTEKITEDISVMRFDNRVPAYA